MRELLTADSESPPEDYISIFSWDLRFKFTSLAHAMTPFDLVRIMKYFGHAPYMY
jgi:hypothetical protein